MGCQGGAFDAGADLGEGGVPGGGGVVGEGGEATVVAGAQAVDGQVTGSGQDAVADQFGGLDAGIDRVGDADEGAGLVGKVIGEDGEDLVRFGLAGELHVEGAGLEPEQDGQQGRVVHVKTVRGVLVTAGAGVYADPGLLGGGEAFQDPVVERDELVQQSAARVELQCKAGLGEVQLDAVRAGIQASSDVGLGLTGEVANNAAPFFQALHRAFVDTDASLLEINPCVLTGDGKLVALDAKMTFDDNGLFRHKELRGLRDLDEEDPLEVEASKYGLNYIKLDGSVGCMVNGAGLAMATMDIIKYAGGSPANFLDVGGGASADQVKNAFRILMSDAAVKAVFINIFGGILRCDVLATGVVAAAKELQLKVPVVVRMEGTNVEQGQQILRDSALNFTIANGMKDGAEKVVALAGGAR